LGKQSFQGTHPDVHFAQAGMVVIVVMRMAGQGRLPS